MHELNQCENCPTPAACKVLKQCKHCPTPAACEAHDECLKNAQCPATERIEAYAQKLWNYVAESLFAYFNDELAEGEFERRTEAFIKMIDEPLNHLENVTKHRCGTTEAIRFLDRVRPLKPKN